MFKEAPSFRPGTRHSLASSTESTEAERGQPRLKLHRPYQCLMRPASNNAFIDDTMRSKSSGVPFNQGRTLLIMLMNK